MKGRKKRDLLDRKNSKYRVRTSWNFLAQFMKSVQVFFDKVYKEQALVLY